MKITKPVLLIIFLLISISFYGQTKDSVQNLDFLSSNFSTTQESLFTHDLDIHSQTSSLILYNRTTKLYDTYSVADSIYVYRGSTSTFKPKTNFLTTLFLGNNSFVESNTLLENRTLLLYEDADYRVRDSFNPHGASNLSEALIGGFFGLLFN